MEDQSGIFKLGFFAACLAGSGLCLWQLVKFQNDYRKTRDLPVKLLKDLDSVKKNQQTFVKFLISKVPQKSYQQKVYSNQRQFCQPSDRIALDQFKADMAGFKKPWQIKDSKGPQAIRRTVQGYGKIYGDIFQYARSFKQQPLSTFGTIWQYISYYLEFLVNIFSSPRQKSLNVNRKPYFMGSFIGYLYYQVSLLADTYLIMKCFINDQGKLVCTLISPSKDFVLKELKEGVNGYFALSAICMIAAIISGKFLYQHLRVKWNQWQTRKDAKSGVYLNPTDLAEDKLCIICYDSCRNAVFMDCRHCVLCVQCSKSYKEEVCPICKNQISCVKLIYKA